MADALLQLRHEAREELTRRILPFWIDAADRRHGGVIGLVTEDGTRIDDAPKGCILHARVLWTFSAAHRALGDDSHRVAAERCAEHFSAHFIDATFGGVYWMIDAAGRAIDDRKHVYAQAFAIYALAEHHAATGEQRSLASAIAIFELIERHARDAERGGYEEAFSREWSLLGDVRLSAVDANERRSMNTHLHLLEAYTTLYAMWPDARLHERLESLVTLFIDRIIAPAGDHTVAFFTEDWQPRSTTISFGHDIEASWLLVEAARSLGDLALIQRAQLAADGLATAVLQRGVDTEHGGVYDTLTDGRLDTDKEWWPQAEAVVGFLAAFQDSGRGELLDAATGAWTFARDHLFDRRHGEWLRRVSRAGDESRGGEKVGPWKCPYHNGRACLQVIARVDALLTDGAAPVASR